MDFQNVADSLGAMTCIMSVEKIGDNDYGKLRVVFDRASGSRNRNAYR